LSKTKRSWENSFEPTSFPENFPEETAEEIIREAIRKINSKTGRKFVFKKIKSALSTTFKDNSLEIETGIYQDQKFIQTLVEGFKVKINVDYLEELAGETKNTDLQININKKATKANVPGTSIKI